MKPLIRLFNTLCIVALLLFAIDFLIRLNTGNWMLKTDIWRVVYFTVFGGKVFLDLITKKDQD